MVDIGCDHAYVPIFLLQEKISPSALAFDIREEPLKRAREHVEEAGLTDRIILRVSDGMEALGTDEADCAVITGMGGRTIIHILKEGCPYSKGIRELILSPQSEAAELRAYLRENNMEIVSEEMVTEKGKYYPVIKATVGDPRKKRKNSSAYDEALRYLEGSGMGSKERALAVCDRYGPYMITGNSAEFRTFMMHEIETYDIILHKLSPEKQPERYEEIKGYLADARAVTGGNAI